MMEAVSTARQPDDTYRLLPLAGAIRRQTLPADLVEYGLVDAFTCKAFEGNPAAVVLLPQAKDDRWMQQVTAEFNGYQAAFLVRKESRAEEGKPETIDDVHLHDLHESGNGHSEQNSIHSEYNIRYFTRTCEVPLCGHATLASSHLLFTTGQVGGDTIVFHCKSGKLTVRKVEPIIAQQQNGVLHNSTHLLELNFPMIPTTACDKFELKSLSTTFRGIEVISVGRTATDDLLVELSSIQEVQTLQPQWHELLQCSGRGLYVTAKDSSQSNIDFMSRCFFPKLGINEDPVCGSAHCALTPYWAAKLGKDSFEAYQASKRGGRLSLRVDLQGERVYLRGEAKTVMTGVILQ